MISYSPPFSRENSCLFLKNEKAKDKFYVVATNIHTNKKQMYTYKNQLNFNLVVQLSQTTIMIESFFKSARESNVSKNLRSFET